MTDGIGRIKAQEFWTEQVRLTPLTADPSDSSEGELWLRADLAPDDDQLATLRLDTGGSTVDIPVFDVAAEVPDDISTQLRLVVDGQQGFVPTTADGSDIPQLGLWSGGVRYGAAEALYAIPDSENLRVYFNSTDTETLLSDGSPASDGSEIDEWVNQDGGLSVTGGFPTRNDGSIQNKTSVDFDGTDDVLERIGLDSQLTQPLTIYSAFKFDSTSGTQNIVTGDDTAGNRDFWQIRIISGEHSLFAGSEIAGGTVDNDFHVRADLLDGPNSLIELDDSQVASGDAGTRGLDPDGPLGFGARPDVQDNNADIKLGIVMVYDAGHDDETRSDVHNFINGQF